MKKRILFALLIATLVAGGAFAQDFKMSAGVGGIFGMGFSKQESSDAKYEGDFTKTGFGGYAFFDATYAEVILGYTYAADKLVVKIDGKEQTLDAYTEYVLGATPYVWGYFTAGLYGKYPIAIGDKARIFPLLGIEYDMLISLSYGGQTAEVDDSGNFSNLWGKGGVGFDIDLSDQIYLRIEALFALKLTTNKWEQIFVDFKKLMMSDYKEGMLAGFTARIAVGYNF